MVHCDLGNLKKNKVGCRNYVEMNVAVKAAVNVNVCRALFPALLPYTPTAKSFLITLNLIT